MGAACAAEAAPLLPLFLPYLQKSVPSDCTLQPNPVALAHDLEQGRRRSRVTRPGRRQRPVHPGPVARDAIHRRHRVRDATVGQDDDVAGVEGRARNGGADEGARERRAWRRVRGSASSCAHRRGGCGQERGGNGAGGRRAMPSRARAQSGRLARGRRASTPPLHAPAHSSSPGAGVASPKRAVGGGRMEEGAGGASCSPRGGRPDGAPCARGACIARGRRAPRRVGTDGGRRSGASPARLSTLAFPFHRSPCVSPAPPLVR